MIRKTLAVGIIFLFIVSSVGSVVLETKENDIELEAELANLRYLCTTPDGFNEVEYESYKEELLNSYSKNDTVVAEPVEKMIPGELPLPFTTGPMDSPWPMKCHDTHHTGLSPYSTAHITGLEKWRRRGIVPGFCGVDGSPIIGDQHEVLTLEKNSTLVDSGVISEEFAGFAFGSNASVGVKYWVYFDEVVHLPFNMSEVEPFDSGITRSYTLQIHNDQNLHETTNFTIIILTPLNETVDFIYELREYNPEGMEELLYWSIGDLIEKAAYFVIVFYFILRLLKPVRDVEASKIEL